MWLCACRARSCACCVRSCACCMLCAHRQLCRTHNTVAGVHAHACAQACLARAQHPISCACPAPYLARSPAPWFATEKHPVATPLWKTLSQHKLFCRDRNVSSLGKLCRDTSRPKPGLAPNPVMTLNFYCNTRPKNLCRDRENLCRNPNHPAGLGTVSRHGDPCCDTEPKGSVLHTHCAIART